MNIAVLGSIAFVVGLGLGTGVVMLRAPAPAAHAPADSTLASHAPAGPAVSPPPAGAATATDPPPAEPSAVPPKSPESGPVSGPSAGPLPAPISAPISAASAAAARPEDFTQVSKILGNMKPAEAAKILAYFNDDQVEGILRATGVRQAALLLTQLPTERAAALSRRLLHPNPEHVQ